MIRLSRFGDMGLLPFGRGAACALFGYDGRVKLGHWTYLSDQGERLSTLARLRTAAVSLLRRCFRRVLIRLLLKAFVAYRRAVIGPWEVHPVRVYLIRFKRFAAAASEPVLPLLAVAFAGIGLLLKLAGTVGNLSATPLYCVVGIAAIFWLVQTRFGYVRRTHDPTWALKYQEMWDAPDTCRRRSIAAGILEDLRCELSNLSKHEGALAGIDDAIDVLEDVGFYVLGDQISPEAAHHHFYYWIQGYWCCAHDYIRAIRTHREPARWQNMEPLFDITSQVELERARGRLTRDKLWLSDDQKAQFVAGEKDLSA